MKPNANNNKHLIALVAGGTGGHIYPALELAKELKKQGCSLLWLGEPDSLESQVAIEHGIEFIGTKLKRIRGLSLVKKIINAFKVFFLIIQCKKLINKKTIQKTIIFGGFVSFPFAIAAKLKGSEIYIHEQNSIAGMTNFLIAPFAKKIFIAFKGSFKGKKVQYVGNPIRKELFQITKTYQSFNSNQKINILVFGGSLGARAINQKIPSMISKLATKYPIHIIHQYGKLDHAPSYKNCQSVEMLNFINDMPQAYDWADMVICRSGAMSVSEVEAIGVFCLFIPFPFAVSNHQFFNAKQSIDYQTRFLLKQDDLNQANFDKVFNQLIDLKKRENRKGIINKSKEKKQFYQNTLKLIIDALH